MSTYFLSHSIPSATLIGSNERSLAEVNEDVIQLDDSYYLSEIDDLDSVAAHEVIGSTSAITAAVKPTAQPKSNDLFPISPRKIEAKPTIKSKVVVVRKPAAAAEGKNRSRNSHDSQTKKRHYGSDKNANYRANRISGREEQRSKLRQAIEKVKRRADKNSVPARTIKFIANPPINKDLAKRAKKEPIFIRLSVNKPLANYTIPKKNTTASSNQNQQRSHTSCTSDPGQSDEPADEKLHAKLSRTQIKNRNRRLAFKRMRDQQKQQQQQQPN